MIKLTGRQQTAVDLLCSGVPIKNIGPEMSVSYQCAQNHLRASRRKFNAKNNFHLAYLIGLEQGKAKE